ncbi:MAG TPA: rod shape-determining protein MreC [Opitutae bacterium]|nr:rod shape-determining protein MreC [Opitutae bacterium]|tara:strand:- start:577 stop:1416 length:840 start_codon:yes stop_codon:yes gene_type:complete
MGKSSVHARPLVLLGCLLLIWWFVPPFIKSFVQVNFFELQAPAWSAASHLKDLQLYWSLRNHSQQELIEAGRDLARLNSAYELSRQKEAALNKEIEHLEKMLNLPPLPNYNYEVARVTRRDINQWWQQLVIRKGKDHGIIEGAPVVYAGGVVGRIQKVFKNTAIVELISSPNFRIAASFEGDRRPVIYQGVGTPAFSNPRGIIHNVPPDYTTESTPKRLVTSRLGGTFPEGLVLGQVDELKARSDGLFQEGKVSLPQNLMSLSEVAILIPLDEDVDTTI